jgi:hypothetical protein
MGEESYVTMCMTLVRNNIGNLSVSAVLPNSSKEVEKEKGPTSHGNIGLAIGHHSGTQGGFSRLAMASTSPTLGVGGANRGNQHACWPMPECGRAFGTKKRLLVA